MEVTRFRAEHREAREAREARRGGDMTAVFPFGTYQMRVVHGAPVAAELPISSRPPREPPSVAPNGG